MALNPLFGVPPAQQGFPTCHRCGFKPFPCRETARGGWIPSGRAGSPWNGGAGNSREGPGRDLAGAPTRAWNLGRAFALPSVPPEVPIPLLQGGGHRGDTLSP